ncbi:adhesion G-protein coupled receptor D1-like [Ptychodera flava]|uniref:adhesion G-protein coupled receptor D1-like n=1 Tax=Ptychodera flava TaxID=63121 RepID=UPI00396A8FA4
MEFLLRDILAEVRGFTDETDVDTIHDALTGALAVTLSEDYQMKLEDFDHVTEIIDLLALTCAKEDNIAESFVEVCSSVLDEKNENILKSQTLSNKLEDTDNATFSFGSHVTSLTLLQYNQKVELNDDFSITLGVKNQQIQTSVSGRSNRSCVFWKYGEGDSAGVWSRDGCWVNDSISNSTYTFCHCNHLTNFAVLMQVVDVEVPPAFNEVMQYITIIGSALSIICLLATIVTYAALRLKSRRIIIHSNLAVALMIAQTLFLLSGEFTNNQDVCGIIAITLHYFFMATFCWLLMEAVHLYLKTVSFTAKEIKNVVYVSLGWGLPVIIVSVSVGVKRVGYGSQDSCWLSTEGGLIWAFVGPALAILMINTGVLVVVMHAFMKLKAIAEKTNRDKIK